MLLTSALRFLIVVVAIIGEVFLPDAAMIVLLATTGIAGLFLVTAQQRQVRRHARREAMKESFAQHITQTRALCEQIREQQQP